MSSMSNTPPEPQLEEAERAEGEKCIVDDVPLPAPTTLATHSGPRILRTSRASSRSNSAHSSRAARSRGSRSSSHSHSRGASRAASRNASPIRSDGLATRINGLNQMHTSASSSLSALTDLDEDEADAQSVISLIDEEQGAMDIDGVEELPDLNIGLSQPEQVQRVSEIDGDNLSIGLEQTSTQGSIVVGELEPLSSEGPVVVGNVQATDVRIDRLPKRRRIHRHSIYEVLNSSPTGTAGPSNVNTISPIGNRPHSMPSSPEIQIISPIASSSAQPPSKQEETKPELSSVGSEPLSAYMCPICFSPPVNATLTPCGHVCCGECLFMAVRASLQRAVVMAAREFVARCPVCRAVLKGWDGRGGGVIGLKPRTMLSL